MCSDVHLTLAWIWARPHDRKTTVLVFNLFPQLLVRAFTLVDVFHLSRQELLLDQNRAL